MLLRLEWVVKRPFLIMQSKNTSKRVYTLKSYKKLQDTLWPYFFALFAWAWNWYMHLSCWIWKSNSLSSIFNDSDTDSILIDFFTNRTQSSLRSRPAGFSQRKQTQQKLSNPALHVQNFQKMFSEQNQRKKIATYFWFGSSIRIYAYNGICISNWTKLKSENLDSE